jgi:hypothetical protein
VGAVSAQQRNLDMLKPVPSITAFFEQLEREIRRCDTEVHEMIVERLDLYCSDKALLAALNGKRSALAAVVAESAAGTTSTAKTKSC